MEGVGRVIKSNLVGQVENRENKNGATWGWYC